MGDDADDSTDITANCNSYTHNTSTNNGESSYGLMVYDVDWNGQVTWPANSQLRDNVIVGSGTREPFGSADFLCYQKKSKHNLSGIPN